MATYNRFALRHRSTGAYLLDGLNRAIWLCMHQNTADNYLAARQLPASEFEVVKLDVSNGRDNFDRPLSTDTDADPAS